MQLLDRIKKAWNVFNGGELNLANMGGRSTYYRPHTRISSGSNARSIVAPLYNRISVDVAAMRFSHIRVNENRQFLSVIKSGLNNCLTVEANIDQSGRSFIQDVAASLCDEGVVAIVPVMTSSDPHTTASYDIHTMRTGQIIQWYPDAVEVRLYNMSRGLFENLKLSKRLVAIVENPLYAVMNEPNSTLRRLVEKLNLLDAIDRQSGSGKLDLIIQLPYVLKSTKRQEQAKIRQAAISEQLHNSMYGIAYIDGTEKITQLNRPAENNMLTQVSYLTSMLYSMLGLTQAVFEGTASTAETLNYFNRTVEPIASAIADAMSRSFITKTGRTQGQEIRAFQTPFKHIGPAEVSEFADTFTRNEILTSNEVRGIVGWYPHPDAGANELRNKNLNLSTSNNELQNGSEVSEVTNTKGD